MEILKMIYEIKKEKEVKIFDYKFVNKNKRKCFMVIENKILTLNDRYILQNKNIKHLKVKLLIYIKERLDLSCMFNEISSLKEFYINSRVKVKPKQEGEKKEEHKISLKENTNENFEEKNNYWN